MSSIFGELTVFNTEGTGAYSARCDRVALGDNDSLLLASVLGDTGVIKGLRAVLNQEGGASLKLSGIDVCHASRPAATATPDVLERYTTDLGGNYEVRIFRVPYGMAHAVVITRRPGFLPAITEAHLWRELNGTRITTPILRPWMAHITAELLRRRLLIEAACYRCRCGLLLATSADLDAIVSEGVGAGLLAFDEGEAPAAEALASEAA